VTRRNRPSRLTTRGPGHRSGPLAVADLDRLLGQIDSAIEEASNRGKTNTAFTCMKGWLVPGRNPFGLYLYLEDVDGLAAVLQDKLSGRRGPEDKPWGMYEFAMSDPDETLVRVGWPSRLRQPR
jgi:hypothetical protein